MNITEKIDAFVSEKKNPLSDHYNKNIASNKKMISNIKNNITKMEKKIKTIRGSGTDNYIDTDSEVSDMKGAIEYANNKINNLENDITSMELYMKDLNSPESKKYIKYLLGM